VSLVGAVSTASSPAGSRLCIIRYLAALAWCSFGLTSVTSAGESATLAHRRRQDALPQPWQHVLHLRHSATHAHARMHSHARMHAHARASRNGARLRKRAFHLLRIGRFVQQSVNAGGIAGGGPGVLVGVAGGGKEGGGGGTRAGWLSRSWASPSPRSSHRCTAPSADAALRARACGLQDSTTQRDKPTDSPTDILPV
jgi:hypothetical protein